MKPVRTKDCDVVYKGPAQDIGDLWCHRVRPHIIETWWELDDEERAIIAAGGRILLGIYKEPIPPVGMGVVPAEESKPVGEHGWKIDVDPGDLLNKEIEPDGTQNGSNEEGSGEEIREEAWAAAEAGPLRTHEDDVPSPGSPGEEMEQR